MSEPALAPSITAVRASRVAWTDVRRGAWYIAVMIIGFDHVTVVVRDIERAVHDYRVLLGCEPSWRGGHSGLGTEAALFALSNAAIELVAPKPDALESEGLRMRLSGQGEGLSALAFSVAGAAEWSKALRERGVRAAPPEEGEAAGPTGGRRRYTTVELSQRSTRGISIFGVERPDATDLRDMGPRDGATVQALDHVVVRTADPEAARALYGEGLGIRLALDHSMGGLRMLFFRVGGVTLECVQDPTAGERDVLHGLAFRVLDVDAARARLMAHGLDVSECRDGKKPGTRVFTVRGGVCGVPTLFLRDPAREGAPRA